ncbi:hypothetical protein E2C01_026215 [Portunus trituberculatus]|uniref:Uncharacterized protein n=1 Tax=Portunus trituberculatus TaxID=210409 RepID=A0A5B7EFF9_PORTR|nr:hypothetical protein [Portunus trituberculatus]
MIKLIAFHVDKVPLSSYHPLATRAILFIVIPILGSISPPKRIFGVRQSHLQLDPWYYGDMWATLNPSTNDKVSSRHVVGFEPTHGRQPDPMLTTLSATPPPPLVRHVQVVDSPAVKQHDSHFRK